MITLDDFEVFCRRSLAGALRTADDLGDGLINVAPAATGGNTPYALVTHLLGAASWWIDHVVLGEPSNRDRDGEFTASGSVADLHRETERWLTSLSARRAEIEATEKLAVEPALHTPLEGAWTVGAALMHIYEEIAQHLGHLEITADIISSEGSEQR